MPTLAKLLVESALHRAIFEACAVPIALVDLRSSEFRVALVNPAFQSGFGHDTDSACGRGLVEMLFDGDASNMQRLLSMPFIRQPMTAKHRDGFDVKCEATVGIVRDSRGALQYAVLAFSRPAGTAERGLEAAVAALTRAAE